MGFGVTYVFGSSLFLAFGFAAWLLGLSTQLVLIGLSLIVGLFFGVLGAALAYGFSAVGHQWRLLFSVVALGAGLAIAQPEVDAVGIIGLVLTYALPSPSEGDDAEG